MPGEYIVYLTAFVVVVIGESCSLYRFVVPCSGFKLDAYA